MLDGRSPAAIDADRDSKVDHEYLGLNGKDVLELLDIKVCGIGLNTMKLPECESLIFAFGMIHGISTDLFW